MKAALAIFLLLTAIATPAGAQLGGRLSSQLGGQLGQLPGALPPVVQGITGRVDNALESAIDRVGDLATQRIDTIRDMVSQHRDVLEQSPDGDLIVRHEIIATAPSDAALTAARAAGFTVARTDTLETLGLSIVVLEAPKGVSTRDALRRLKSSTRTAPTTSMTSISVRNRQPGQAPATWRALVEAGSA